MHKSLLMKQSLQHQKPFVKGQWQHRLLASHETLLCYVWDKVLYTILEAKVWSNSSYLLTCVGLAQA